MRLAFFSVLIACILSLSIYLKQPVAPVESVVVEKKATTTPVLINNESVKKPKMSTQAPEKVTNSETIATTSPVKTTVPERPQTLPMSFTAATLARYDGSDASLPILIALEGNVYDVSTGRDYYEPGAAYHFLAGTNGTTLLQAIGGDIIKRKYPVVGTFTE